MSTKEQSMTHNTCAWECIKGSIVCMITWKLQLRAGKKAPQFKKKYLLPRLTTWFQSQSSNARRREPSPTSSPLTYTHTCIDDFKERVARYSALWFHSPWSYSARTTSLWNARPSFLEVNLGKSRHCAVLFKLPLNPPHLPPTPLLCLCRSYCIIALNNYKPTSLYLSGMTWVWPECWIILVKSFLNMMVHPSGIHPTLSVTEVLNPWRD